MSQQPLYKIQQSYDEIIEGLFTGKLSFRKTVSIPLTRFGLNEKNLNNTDKIIIV
jgi:hypothetical protein